MGERRGTKGLELWCRRMTDGYPGVNVTNMTTSWRDGLAFCAIIHRFRPDLIDFNKLNKDDVYHNNELAFRVAERHLGIPALLEPEDMVQFPVPDRLSILTYLSQFYQVFVVAQGAATTRTTNQRLASAPSNELKPSPSPPTRSKVALNRGAEGVCGPIQREPCASCRQPVFIAERLNVGRVLYHRQCFRCARCSSQLTLANYYETESGDYCCETCPDEEELDGSREVLRTAESVAKIITADIDDKSPFLPDAAAAAALNITSCSLSDEEKSQQQQQQQQQQKQRSNRLVSDPRSNLDWHNSRFIIKQSPPVLLDMPSIEIIDDSLNEPPNLQTVSSRRSSTCSSSNSTKASTYSISKDLETDSRIEDVVEQSDQSTINLEQRATVVDVNDDHDDNVDVNDKIRTAIVEKETEAPLLPLFVKDVELKEFSDSVFPPYSDSIEETNIALEKDVTAATTSDTDITAAVVVEVLEKIVSDVFVNRVTIEAKKEDEVVQKVDKEPVVQDIEQKRIETDKSMDSSAKDDNYPDDLNPFDDETEIEDVKVDNKQEVEESRKKGESRVPVKQSAMSLNPFDEEDADSSEEKSFNPFECDEEFSQSSTAISSSAQQDCPSSRPIPKPRTHKLGIGAKSLRQTQNTTTTGAVEKSVLSSRRKVAAPSPPAIKLSDNVHNQSVVSTESTDMDTSSIYSFSLSAQSTPRRSRKCYKAPAPPVPTSSPLRTDISSLAPLPEDDKLQKDEWNRSRQMVSNKSLRGKWKRRKGMAPTRPIAQRRCTSATMAMSLADIRKELDLIELQQQGLEKQGVRLEQMIRQRFETDDTVEHVEKKLEESARNDSELEQLEDKRSALNEENVLPTIDDIELDKKENDDDDEDLIIQLFELVNEKNELFRKQTELMYLRRQHRLEEEHADVEYQIRCLMLRPEANKTDSDKAKEEELIGRLIEIVERRNEVIECLEMDRVREAEEDDSINSQMNLYALMKKSQKCGDGMHYSEDGTIDGCIGGGGGGEWTDGVNKKKKKKSRRKLIKEKIRHKLKQMHPLKGGTTVEDADKDVDDVEAGMQKKDDEADAVASHSSSTTPKDERKKERKKIFGFFSTTNR